MEEKRYTLFQNWGYLYSRMFGYKKYLCVCIPLAMLCELSVMLISNLLPAVAVALITGGYGVGMFLGMMGVVTGVYMVISFIRTSLQGWLSGNYTDTRIQKMIVPLSEKMIRTDYCNVEPIEMQRKAEKAMSSLENNWIGAELIWKNTPAFLVKCIGILLFASALSMVDWRIIFIIALMAILNIVFNIYSRYYERVNKAEAIIYDKKIDYLYNNSINLKNGKDVRIFKLEKWFYQVGQQLIAKRIRWKRKIEARYFLPDCSDNILAMIRDLAAYSILCAKAIQGELGIAEFTFYIGVVAGFSTWLKEAIEGLADIQRASLQVDDYRNYENIGNRYNHKENNPLPEFGEKGIPIEFKNVSFRYEGAEKDTISNLSLKIEAGSKIAIVGNNGAGKTTLVKLLSGLYYPTGGELLVGGQSVTEYNIEKYQKLIGTVFQNVEILACTLEQNIACCVDSKIDSDRVKQSLKTAGLLEKVNQLKDKEKTNLTQIVDEDGILLSGGEMQKLMLARALYKDAPIMILDEPTAALDPLAESEMYEKYSELSANKTSLFISHRLASTKFCDRVLFMESGQIVEDGTHESLLEAGGNYAKMFEIQSHYYQEELEGGEDYE